MPKSEPHQDAFDLGLPEPAGRTPDGKPIPQKGYVVQVKVADPPLCALCIDEMYVTKTRKQASPNRITHRVWMPTMTNPVLMCAEHAMDFSTRHGLSRVNIGRGRQ